MKAFVIGNSHAATLSGMQFGYENTPIGLFYQDNVWALWNIYISAYNVEEYNIEQMLDVVKSEIDENSILLGYLGSSDIRNNLLLKNNTNEVANNYISVFEKVAKKYKLKLGFIDPVPMPNDTYFFEKDSNYNKWGEGSREEILAVYKEFISVLHRSNYINIPNIGKDFIDRNDSWEGCHLNPERSNEILSKIKFLVN